MAFTYVTVQATYETADDLPASGRVEFTPVDQMRNGLSIAEVTVGDDLDSAGAMSIRLAATTDPATRPVGVTYRVVEKITGQPNRTYYVSVPHDQGPTLQLADLTVITSSGGAGFELRNALDYDNSVAPTDGQVMTWDGTTSKFHPEAVGGGAGAVSSVNGLTGAVTLTASGLGAQPVDDDLTAFAVLAPADGSLLGRQSGAWVGRTPTQAKTDLALDQVDNTSDAAKPISTAVSAALAAKAPLASPTFTGTPTAPRFVGAVQTVTYAASITLDASQYTSFRVPSATGDITTTTITNGTAGQIIYLRVQASGGDRTVTVAGSNVTVTSGTWRVMTLAYDAPTSAWQLQAVTSAGGGGIPDDGSVTNAKVAVAAAIDLDKTADSATRLAMTTAERSTLAGLTERIQDDAAALFTGGVHSGISFAYNDASNRVDATVTGGAGTSTVAKNTQTGSYTLALSDAGKVVEIDSATSAALTVPANSSVAIPVDSVIEVCQLGAGQITLTPDSGAGTTFTEPFTTTLALTWATVFGGAVSVSGGNQGTLSGSDTRVRAQHDVGTSDMFAQVTWVSGGADADRAFGVCTRYSSSADTAYVFQVNDNLNRWELFRISAGVGTGISGVTSLAIASPVTIRLESQGSTHRCYINGSLVGTFTDSNIATGQRGGLAGYQPSGILFDNFSAGALTSIALRTPASLTTRAKYSTVALRKRGVDEWVISGDLT